MNGIFVLHQFIKFDIGNYLKNIKTRLVYWAYKLKTSVIGRVYTTTYG